MKYNVPLLTQKKKKRMYLIFINQCFRFYLFSRDLNLSTEYKCFNNFIISILILK